MSVMHLQKGQCSGKQMGSMAAKGQGAGSFAAIRGMGHVFPPFRQFLRESNVYNRCLYTFVGTLFVELSTNICESWWYMNVDDTFCYLYARLVENGMRSKRKEAPGQISVGNFGNKQVLCIKINTKVSIDAQFWWWYNSCINKKGD